MELKRFFLEQLEREVVLSRRVIEQVPEGHSRWKPHDKSMEMGYLAALVATMAGWAGFMIERDELDLSDPSGTFRPRTDDTQEELQKSLAGEWEKSRKALENTTEEHLLLVWRLKKGQQVLIEQPRYVMIADSVSHLAHHRGQLTVYLRLLGAKVPAIYGPSADEPY
jgi:uncharacterized damage-inducible protein DinB